MKKVARNLQLPELPRSYGELVALHSPRPLHDRIDERNVEEIVMAMAGHDLTADQEDYLDVLSDLLLKYHAQRESHTTRKQNPRQRLAYLLEQSETTPVQLAKILGCSQPLVSLVLAGKRSLTTTHIRSLAAHFKLSPAYFI